MREMRWLAQHADGEVLRERELVNGQWMERSFYEIRKHELLSFGLEGTGLRIGFQVTDGIIGINDMPIEVALVVGCETWPLTGRKDVAYSDVIQYKDAEVLMAVNGARSGSGSVTQYNAGYKCTGIDDGLGQWHYQVIVHVPANKQRPIIATFRLVIECGFNGDFVVRYGAIRRIVRTILRPNVSNQLQMTFQT